LLKRPLSLLSLTRAIMFILLGSIYYSICDDSEIWRRIFVITATILFIGNHLLSFSIHLKAYQTLFIALDLGLTACFGFFFAGESNLYLIMFGILAVSLFIMTDKRKVLYSYILLFFLLWGSILYFTFIETNQFTFADNLVNFMFIVFCAVVGGLIRRLQVAREKAADQFHLLSKSHQELSDVHEQLRSYSKQVEELTVIRERNQIAREIHDTVGHKMTALIVQLQLARELMPLDLEKSKQTIQNCEGLARASLGEIRTSVRTLREDDGISTTFLATLQTLLKEFSQMTELEVSLEIAGDPTNTPTSIQPTIIRIIQESLTNSKKHGNATQCHVSINCQPDIIKLAIDDNGTGVKQVQPSFGLINMRERVIEHGGSIQYESTIGQGFRVNVGFPLKQFRWNMRGTQ
jgi:signal transduction histidine kinase